MSQENVQTDTPQNQSNEPQFASLEEAVFGGNDIVSEGSADIESAFTTGNQEANNTAPEATGQPVENNQVQPQSNNDETRYQYWQSQADKLKNENEQLKQAMQQQPQQQMQQPVQPVEPAQPGIEDFPPAPAKPEKPRTFNRDEAYADPASESARYLDEVEEWRDNMNEYNSLKTQYQTAVVEEKLQAMENAKIDEIKRQQAYQQKAAQESQIREHVMVNHNMTASEARDFMSKMSNPKSINIDNLVQLYRMQQGGAANAQTSSQPSPDFQQVQNAQQIPSPMGVMPSGSTNEDGRSFEDKIMDTMIGNFNSKNPWK
tara:strand:+ start:5540 stop:6490 length:951 start_codon:yes stop_codon:yes gene_type:complete